MRGWEDRAMGRLDIRKPGHQDIRRPGDGVMGRKEIRNAECGLRNAKTQQGRR